MAIHPECAAKMAKEPKRSQFEEQIQTQNELLERMGATIEELHIKLQPLLFGEETATPENSIVPEATTELTSRIASNSRDIENAASAIGGVIKRLAI